MGYIHCCGGLHKCKSFKISPENEFQTVEMDFLEKCPNCGHTIVQVTRLDFENKISIIRKINSKAIKMFEKLQSKIITSKNMPVFKNIGRFYLNYNEYGKVKKCYSNLSSLKMGKFESKSLINF